MSKTTLPLLSKMVFPAYRTITKGVKISNQDIKVEEEFSNVSFNAEKLKDYRAYFNFKSELPITYIYVIAQRALLHLMLNKKFTISVPGMVHISNEINLTPQFDLSKEFTLKSSMHVPVKDGSLYPTAVIRFYQNGLEVASNTSNYIAKRKSTQKRSKREESASNFKTTSFKEDWIFEKSVGKSYAKLSNDKNPIHTSKLMSKMLGFKGPIAHGWYSVSKAVASAEKQKSGGFKSLKVAFSKPVYLPSKVQFEMDNELNFKITNPQKEYSYLEGKLD